MLHTKIRITYSYKYEYECKTVQPVAMTIIMWSWEGVKTGENTAHHSQESSTLFSDLGVVNMGLEEEKIQCW